MLYKASDIAHSNSPCRWVCRLWSFSKFMTFRAKWLIYSGWFVFISGDRAFCQFILPSYGGENIKITALVASFILPSPFHHTFIANSGVLVGRTVLPALAFSRLIEKSSDFCVCVLTPFFFFFKLCSFCCIHNKCSTAVETMYASQLTRKKMWLCW